MLLISWQMLLKLSLNWASSTIKIIPFCLNILSAAFAFYEADRATLFLFGQIRRSAKNTINRMSFTKFNEIVFSPWGSAEGFATNKAFFHVLKFYLKTTIIESCIPHLFSTSSPKVLTPTNFTLPLRNRISLALGFM